MSFIHCRSQGTLEQSCILETRDREGMETMENARSKSSPTRARTLSLMLGVRKWRSSALPSDIAMLKEKAALQNDKVERNSTRAINLRTTITTSPKREAVSTTENSTEPKPLRNGKRIEVEAARDENVAENIKEQTLVATKNKRSSDPASDRPGGEDEVADKDRTVEKKNVLKDAKDKDNKTKGPRSPARGGRPGKRRKPRLKKEVQWAIEEASIERAEKRGIVFIKMRGFPLWPAQKIPERKTKSDNVPKRPSGLPDYNLFFFLSPSLSDMCTGDCVSLWSRKV